MAAHKCTKRESQEQITLSHFLTCDGGCWCCCKHVGRQSHNYGLHDILCTPRETFGSAGIGLPQSVTRRYTALSILTRAIVAVSLGPGVSLVRTVVNPVNPAAHDSRSGFRYKNIAETIAK